MRLPLTSPVMVEANAHQRAVVVASRRAVRVAVRYRGGAMWVRALLSCSAPMRVKTVAARARAVMDAVAVAMLKLVIAAPLMLVMSWSAREATWFWRLSTVFWGRTQPCLMSHLLVASTLPTAAVEMVGAELMSWMMVAQRRPATSSPVVSTTMMAAMGRVR